MTAGSDLPPDRESGQSLSVVVPCYRSAGTLPELIFRLRAVLAGLGGPHEIILVVDGSPDDAWAVATDLSRTHPDVRSIRLSRNYGQQNALLAGIRLARYDLVATLDDDLQHRPEDLPLLLRALTGDADLVYGVAKEEGHGWARGLATRVGRLALARGLGVTHARHVTAYRLFRTRLREGFADIAGPHVSVDVALSWATTEVRGVRVARDPRLHGVSNYTARSLLRQFLGLVLGYSILPLRLVSYLGLVSALTGVGLLVYVVAAYATGYTAVPGFTFLASMIALFSGAQMLAIGVVGEYLGRLHNRSSGRPSYVITRSEP